MLMYYLGTDVQIFRERWDIVKLHVNAYRAGFTNPSSVDGADAQVSLRA